MGLRQRTSTIRPDVSKRNRCDILRLHLSDWRDVNPASDNQRLAINLKQDTRNLAASDNHVIWPFQTGLKWPNDVIVAGGKISGILLEVDGKALIVGSGINIAPVGQMESQNIAPIALADVWPDGAGALPQPHDLATAYLDRLAFWYDRFCQSGFDPIRDAWLENALFLGKRVAVQCDRKALSGVFHDLGMDGTMLLLDDSGQTRHITTGDVKLLGS